MAVKDVRPQLGRYEVAERQKVQNNTITIIRYHEMLDEMDRLGIEPNATLHHFTHPTWFEDDGAFEAEGNIEVFAQYAAAMFREVAGGGDGEAQMCCLSQPRSDCNDTLQFGKRIKLWCTFNEPTCYTFLAYIRCC